MVPWWFGHLDWWSRLVTWGLVAFWNWGFYAEMLCRDSTDCEPPTIGIYWIYWLWIRDSIRRVEKLRAFQALDVGRIWKTTCNFTAVGYPWVGPKMVNIPPHTFAMFMFMGKMMITVHLANFKTPFAKPNCLICPTWLWVWKLGSGSKFVPSRKPQSSGSSLFSKKSMIFEVYLCRSAQWPTSQHELISTGQPWTGHQTLQHSAFRGFSWTFQSHPRYASCSFWRCPKSTNKQKLVTEAAQLQRI